MYDLHWELQIICTSRLIAVQEREHYLGSWFIFLCAQCPLDIVQSLSNPICYCHTRPYWTHQIFWSTALKRLIVAQSVWPSHLISSHTHIWPFLGGPDNLYIDTDCSTRKGTIFAFMIHLSVCPTSNVHTHIWPFLGAPDNLQHLRLIAGQGGR